MSLRKFAVSSRSSVFCLALILILAVGALASGLGIVFQGFETDVSMWFNNDVAQEIVREGSGYINGGYASGIASATGNYHARLVVDPASCLDDGSGSPPPNNDCYGPNTYWNEIRVSDGTTTGGSNIITSATANFTAADVGRAVYAKNPVTNDLVFSPGTTVTSVTNSTTAVVSTNAIESSTNATLRVFSLFSLGYITQVDIYLDVAWAAGNSDWRFDWDSAIRDNALNFDSDYAFNVGTQLSGDGTPGFWVGTSTNAGRGNTYPENPCPSPGIDGIGNHCRAPFKITTSGWYTFRHIYRIDPATHNLSIEFQVVPKAGGSPVVDQTIYGWQGNAQAPAGGIMPAYGWFTNQEIPELAIDNSLLKDFDTLALSPTNPSPLGAGTIQTFTLSASLFGVADPLTPGLTPANVTFTQGNTDTGSVTVVPSGTQPGNGTFSFDATGGSIGSVNLTANIDTSASNTVSFNVIAPALYSPANGSTLPGSTVTFYWTEYPGATAYWLDVGATLGGNTYAQSGSLSSSTLSYTVNSLPTNGSTVYARWYYYVSGSWQHSDYSYTANGGASSKGVITSPVPGSYLTGTSVTFTWTAGSGATAYWLDIGSSPGGNNYYQSGNLGNVFTTTVYGLPTNGTPVYVTLWSYVAGQWLNYQYTYTAYTLGGGLAVMQTPVPGSTLSGNSATFTWSAGAGATAYWMDAGSTPFGNQYYQSGNLGNVLTTTVNTLPQNNTTVYVTLYSYLGGQWQYNQYTYNSSMAFQGFETNIGDWQPDGTTFRIASGGGVLGLTAASGGYYAEVHNIDNDYINGYYGDSGYSFFGFPTQPPYPGNFSQSIKMYVNANWPVALYGGPGVWIDEAPGNPDPNNYGAEHNFRLTPTGTAVGISVDGQPSPIVTITTSGWYNFQMTFQKGSLPTDLVTTHMNVFNSSGTLIGTTTVVSNSPGGPLLSQDLEGPGYVWITVWPNGWAGDVLGIDDVRADLL